MSVSCVLARLGRHWALTVSRPCADLRRLLRRLAHLDVPTWGKEPVSAGSGWAGKKEYASTSRHCRLTVSPASANVTLIILRVADLAFCGLADRTF
jgi:hypothetical protein